MRQLFAAGNSHGADFLIGGVRMTLHKYYMLQRPPAPGSIPGEGLYQTKDFEERRELGAGHYTPGGWN